MNGGRQRRLGFSWGWWICFVSIDRIQVDFDLDLDLDLAFIADLRVCGGW